jgi:hypothetical protein
MKYLCLVFYDEKKLEAMSERDAQALDDRSIEYAEAFEQAQHLVSGHALHSTHAATTVRVQSGKVSVTDGPFAETHEQIGGFLLIEARDLNEAIQIVSKMPALPLGGIEIRPVRELVHSGDSSKKR